MIFLPKALRVNFPLLNRAAQRYITITSTECSGALFIGSGPYVRSLFLHPPQMSEKMVWVSGPTRGRQLAACKLAEQAFGERTKSPHERKDDLYSIYSYSGASPRPRRLSALRLYLLLLGGDTQRCPLQLRRLHHHLELARFLR